jgi:hypothetical protein
MEATVGDTEFWMLAKRVVAGGGTLDSTDTVFSLNAKLTDLMTSAGPGPSPGGGVPEAPTDGQLYGRENSAWAVVPPIASGPFIAKAGQTIIDRANIPVISSSDGSRTIGLDCNAVSIQNVNVGLTIIEPAQITLENLALAFNQIHIDSTTGDLIVTQTVGPNAGKSVNLTAGKWA